MSEKLVNEQAVIDVIDNFNVFESRGDQIALEIKIRELPSAEPQIIYCKDCKYYHRNIACVGGEYSGCSLWLNEGNEIEVEENDFCSCAERRTDG